MKFAIYILLFLVSTISSVGYSQTFVNGDFENNTAVVDQINLSNIAYNSFMSSSLGFGSFGNLDIITSAVYSGGPQSGNWFVALTGGGTDQLSLQLSSPLVQGNSYTITFFDKSDYTFISFPVEIGLSTTNSNFGILVYTTPSAAINSIWTQRTFTFVAPNNGQYITVSQQGVLGNWVNIDNFSFDSCSVNLNLGNDTTLCQGDTLILDATTPGANYLWQNNSTNPTFNVTQQGTYWVEVIMNNCSITDTISVTYNPLPAVNLGNDTIICYGDTLTLDANIPNSTCRWQDNSTNPVYNVTQQGTYWVEVILNNCIATDTINVNYNQLSSVFIGNDTVLCQGDTLVLDATIPNGTYLWHDNSTNPTYNVSQQGTYWVEVTLNNCSSTDTINVTYYQALTVNLGSDTVLCIGDTLILDATIPNSTYLWQDNSTDSVYAVSQQGIYWVEVNLNNCSGTDTINVAYNLLPTVNLGNDTVLCFGNTLTLNATIPGGTYLWQDNSTSSTLNVTQQGTYWVEAGNDCGFVSCTLAVEYQYCDCELYIPSAFTPDDDGLNDKFLPISECEFTEYQIIVYNRWGEKLFESSVPDESWDGTYKGEKLPIGVYVYLVIYKFENMEKLKKSGRVTLVR